MHCIRSKETQTTGKKSWSWTDDGQIENVRKKIRWKDDFRLGNNFLNKLKKEPEEKN